MGKTYSDTRPKTLLPLNDGNYHVNFNISEETMPVGMLGNEQEEPRTQFVYETVFIEGKATMQKIEMAMLADGFTQQEVDSHRAEIEAALADIDNQNN